MKKQWTSDIIAYVTGSVLYALSVSVFSTPNDIAPGGAAGLGILVKALTGIPVGAVVLVINLPLLTAAYIKLSRSFALRSAAVTVLSAVVMDVTEPLIPGFTGDRLLAALFGGLIGGAGIGMIMRHMGSTGGSEVAAWLLRKKHPHMSVGTLIFAVDAAVIALSAVVFGQLASALYAAVQVFVCSLTVDHMIYGREEGRLLFIVTSRPQAVCEAVTKRLARGITAIRAVGGYSGNDTTLLLCAVSRIQLPLLQEMIAQTDEHAFVMVVDTRRVTGEGFASPSTL